MRLGGQVEGRMHEATTSIKGPTFSPASDHVPNQSVFSVCLFISSYHNVNVPRKKRKKMNLLLFLCLDWFPVYCEKGCSASGKVLSNQMSTLALGADHMIWDLKQMRRHRDLAACFLLLFENFLQSHLQPYKFTVCLTYALRQAGPTMWHWGLKSWGSPEQGRTGITKDTFPNSQKINLFWQDRKLNHNRAWMFRSGKGPRSRISRTDRTLGTTGTGEGN